MKLALLRRIRELEELRKPLEDGRITLRYAHLHMLPRTYIGEKHRVLVAGFPSESPDTDCVIQEFPGPGPELNFGFDRRTILIKFVESNGNGRTKGYLPDDPEAAKVAPMAMGRYIPRQ
jgi:hypothetical protein